MADPRTYTVKQCPPAYAAKSGAGIGSATSARRDFANSVGKIGDLEVLNSVGGGSIGRGLRNLASISNSIRTGCGALPTAIGSSIDAGANWVLEQTGIAASTVEALRGFHPEIANQAYGQAKAVFDQIQQGNFKSTDVPSVLQDFQNLERLARNIFVPGRGDAQTSLGGVCEASPYAVDLLARAPKYKFLFIVEFIPNPAYAALVVGGVPVLEMAFTVKKSSRPNIKFQTEDVNYYNYRTSTITKTAFEEMNMSFHDDIRNAATQFYNAYLKAVSPIANLDPAGGHTNSTALEGRGMEFNDNLDIPFGIVDEISSHRYAASSGTLAGGEKTVFSRINLYHVFDYGNKMTVYNFINPRITSLAPDDLDMSASEGSELSITFNYDSVYVDPEIDLSTSDKYGNIRDKQPNAIYQMQYHGAASTMGPNNKGIDPFGTTTSGSSTCDPLNKTNTSISSGTSGNPAVAALGNLASKFSSLI